MNPNKTNKIAENFSTLTEQAGKIGTIITITAASILSACGPDDMPQPQEDHPTVFGQTELTIAENSTGTIATIEISDQNGIKSVMLEGDIAEYCDIDNSGNITLKPGKTLDFETISKLSGKIIVIDNEENSAENTINLTLTNEKEITETSTTQIQWRSDGVLNAYLGTQDSVYTKYDDNTETTEKPNQTYSPEITNVMNKYESLANNEHGQFSAEFLQQIVDGSAFLTEHFEVVDLAGNGLSIIQKATSNFNFQVIDGVTQTFEGNNHIDKRFIGNKLMEGALQLMQQVKTALGDILPDQQQAAPFSLQGSTWSVPFEKISAKILTELLQGKIQDSTGKYNPKTFATGLLATLVREELNDEWIGSVNGPNGKFNQYPAN